MSNALRKIWRDKKRNHDGKGKGNGRNKQTGPLIEQNPIFGSTTWFGGHKQPRALAFKA